MEFHFALILAVKDAHCYTPGPALKTSGSGHTLV
jgi:hypothetical protein